MRTSSRIAIGGLALLWLVAVLSVPAQAPKKAPPKVDPKKGQPKSTPKTPVKEAEPKEVVALRTLGATLDLEGKRVVGVNLAGTKANDATLAGLSGFKLRTLDLSGCVITDNGL